MTNSEMVPLSKMETNRGLVRWRKLPTWGTIAVASCIFALIFASGCASVIIKKLPPGGAPEHEGIRFYRPYPYLLVSETAEKGQSSTKDGNATKPLLQFKIIWLPDISQEYAISPKSGFGSVEFNPTLEDGWKLTGVNLKLDSKTAELITAVGGVLEKAAKVVTARGTGEPLKTGLYRFVYQTDPTKPNYGLVVSIDWEHPVFGLTP